MTEEFAVPNNLYIVGTMNSADKSIALIDTALRRRFKFIEVAPNPELVTDAVLKSVLEKLNEILRKQLDSSDLLIGHAYFLNKTTNDLVEILNGNIIPLLMSISTIMRIRLKMQFLRQLRGLKILNLQTMQMVE